MYFKRKVYNELLEWKKTKELVTIVCTQLLCV